MHECCFWRSCNWWDHFKLHLMGFPLLWLVLFCFVFAGLRVQVYTGSEAFDNFSSLVPATFLLWNLQGKCKILTCRFNIGFSTFTLVSVTGDSQTVILKQKILFVQSLGPWHFWKPCIFGSVCVWETSFIRNRYQQNMSFHMNTHFLSCNEMGMQEWSYVKDGQ